MPDLFQNCPLPLVFEMNSFKDFYVQFFAINIRELYCDFQPHSNLVKWACFCFSVFDFDLECWEIIAKKNIWILCKSFFMLDFCHLCFSILNANWSFEKNKYLLFTYRFKVNTIAIERFLIVWEKIKHLPLPFISDCD